MFMPFRVSPAPNVTPVNPLTSPAVPVYYHNRPAVPFKKG
jgi:hypothetical protein